ncbi:hypothetical protein BDN72DRAFT_780313 [Pluteus cervinus]|uniref:Uncharacterized protein n=1 Tax=Pluteus cervinus TaxID=181527 RepID=A0ACD3A249_9AGAR|nr:hypothetical protein BDN72DRAFT_780313 [Pluteus cervinus]
MVDVWKSHPSIWHIFHSFFLSKPTPFEPLPVTIAALVFSLKNQVEHILVTQPPWAIPAALQDNINTYALAVLLSPKLSAYKGSSPNQIVVGIIKRFKLHIPDNFERDERAMNTLDAEVGEALTQKRSHIKKMVKVGITKGSPIYDLALTVVEGSRCKVTIGLCSRLALFRKVYNEEPQYHGSNYWDGVDARLGVIRKTAGGDQQKITRAFTYILEADQEKYGTSTATFAIDGADWQQSVDEEIEHVSSP